jgi:hypothetical protein
MCSDEHEVQFRKNDTGFTPFNAFALKPPALNYDTKRANWQKTIKPQASVTRNSKEGGTQR